MKKNGLYLVLAGLVIAWALQYFLFQPESEVTSETATSKGLTSKAQAEKKLTSKDNTRVQKPKAEPLTPPKTAATRETALAVNDTTTEAYYTQALDTSRLIKYKNLTGYAELVQLLESGCGNFIDTDLERQLIDVEKLSGQAIFVSEPFCMESAIWNRFRSIDEDRAKGMSRADLKRLQQSFNELLRTVPSKTEQVFVTEMFVNAMAQHYTVLPTYERNGNEFYQVTVFVLTNINNTRHRAVLPFRFRLSNSYDIPVYFFQDALENTLEQEQKRIRETYAQSIADLFK